MHVYIYYMGTLEWHADRMSSDTDHHRTGVVRRYLPMCVCFETTIYTRPRPNEVSHRVMRIILLLYY